MKFNWVNLLATLLIIGGVFLLIERRMHTQTTRHIPTVEEAKADIVRQIELKMGRPLSDAETEMIDVTKSGEQISITLHQPLTGRLMKAIHDAKASTQPGVKIPETSIDALTAPAIGKVPLVAPADGTTLPSSTLP